MFQEIGIVIRRLAKTCDCKSNKLQIVFREMEFAMEIGLSLFRDINVQVDIGRGTGRVRVAGHSKVVVQRWLSVLEAHGLSTEHVPRMFPDLGVSIGDVADLESIGHLLNDTLLSRTSELFNVQRAYLDGDECAPYEVELLDRECDTFTELLLRLQMGGGDVELIAMRSGNQELECDWSQAGALLLRTRVFDWDTKSVYRYTPIFSLQNWGNPEQRWRAMRAMWIAHEFGCGFWGDKATSDQALMVAEGKVFPEAILSCQHPKCWHPDDYVVRPSSQAKGGNIVNRIKSQIASRGQLQEIQESANRFRELSGA